VSGVVRVAVAGLAASCICVLLRKSAPEMAVLSALAACVYCFFALSGTLEAVRDYILMLSELSGLSFDVLKPVFQCLGLGLVAKYASDGAKDAGQGAIASVIDFAGSICCLYVTLPLAKRTIDLVEAML